MSAASCTLSRPARWLTSSRTQSALACASVPKIVLTLSHASGAGYHVMAGQGFDPTFTLAWPTARIGVMEGDSAMQALHGAELEKYKSSGHPVPQHVALCGVPRGGAGDWRTAGARTEPDGPHFRRPGSASVKTGAAGGPGFRAGRARLPDRRRGGRPEPGSHPQRPGVCPAGPGLQLGRGRRAGRTRSLRGLSQSRLRRGRASLPGEAGAAMGVARVTTPQSPLALEHRDGLSGQRKPATPAAPGLPADAEP